jgi:hypothetical protein
VVVHPGAEEGDLVVTARVAARERRQVVVHVLLRHPRREVERPAQPYLLGHLRAEDLVERSDADGVEHLAAVRVGGRGVAAQGSRSFL